MFAATMNSRASAYRTLSIETGVPEASPHRLIAMLFDGAVESIARARAARSRRDPAGRARAIARAVRIVDEGLKASLDPAGGEIASNLGNLYGYIALRLSEANHSGDDSLLDEADRLLRTVRDAWEAIAADPSALR
jgi:flagellar protein FliS